MVRPKKLRKNFGAFSTIEALSRSRHFAQSPISAWPGP
jgi:hypothetical protein